MSANKKSYIISLNEWKAIMSDQFFSFILPYPYIYLFKNVILNFKLYTDHSHVIGPFKTLIGMSKD